ncbi:MAG: 5-deoxy-glucuronate isomerase [Clostridium sp.]|uniref:5-deoxy-glucuronate isomerase n=1 Tax=Clostridium sp. TaxID=1506 RepID=UPI0025BC4B4A|nr:5-deoxy-glucuronate isomerase [Clostridium sp.]MCH3965801.1 5-deoxy-glucuronate isomerase [Clostridium sp.]MCI1717307.1 5-deoxy-glucuronate isomerase [Clostridium sp.]MCI1801647.1 5-deoxy-glucuronate isomerase [Clostridium sp.]MCI1815493.1 5-deoxy-glucuronate isomerase [Clostridium sp.]MCI1872408.1 5-deoxy-glucuronate isomerase [Clostridium sp.]
MLKIRQNEQFKLGYNSIIKIDEIEDNALVDFGVLRLGKNQAEIFKEDKKEMAFLLIQGEIIFELEGNKKTVKRTNCFDEEPWVLHVSKGVNVIITGACDNSEVGVIMTYNNKVFKSKLYTQEDCKPEIRGKGTMNECSTRIVRTAFDIANAPYSNLVLGEVVNFPGKWSSFPPHYHPQPEIYFYKFTPEGGYGFSQLGENVNIVRENDTVKILNQRRHPQVAAPGYAMYYIWIIRNLDGNPYRGPVFNKEYEWTNDKNARIWPEK